MVYCSKCGAENEDDALVCKSCGASLRPTTGRVYRRRRDDDLCFGTQKGLPIGGIIFGIIIILVGAISLLERTYWWASWDRLWPLVIIAFGLLIVANTLYKR